MPTNRTDPPASAAKPRRKRGQNRKLPHELIDDSIVGSDTAALFCGYTADSTHAMDRIGGASDSGASADSPATLLLPRADQLRSSSAPSARCSR